MENAFLHEEYFCIAEYFRNFWNSSSTISLKRTTSWLFSIKNTRPPLIWLFWYESYSLTRCTRIFKQESTLSYSELQISDDKCFTKQDITKLFHQYNLRWRKTWLTENWKLPLFSWRIGSRGGAKGSGGGRHGVEVTILSRTQKFRAEHSVSSLPFYACSHYTLSTLN